MQDYPINLGMLSHPSEDKTSPVEEYMKLFPKTDIIKRVQSLQKS